MKRSSGNSGFKIRHTWVNFPTMSQRKCTRCGIVKRNNRYGIKGEIFIMPDGRELTVNPQCIKQE